MSQVRKNEISLRKCSGGSAQLRSLEGRLVTKNSARFDNDHYDSEPESQVRLLARRRKLKFFKDTYFQTHSVLFPMSE